MKSLGLRLLVGFLTFTVGLGCTKVTVNFARPESEPGVIKALDLPRSAVEIPEIQIAEPELLETVFRSLMQQCYQDEPNSVFFISYQQGDLPAEFLSRLDSEGILVKSRSQMRRYFLAKGKPGILLGISAVDWIGPSSVEVSCSCGRGALDGYSYSIRLVRGRKVWKVMRMKLVGVS